MKHKGLEKIHCNGCNKKLDAATPIENKKDMPSADCVTVCIYCGCIQVYRQAGDELTLKKMTDSDMKDFENQWPGQHKKILAARAFILWQRSREN
jgi:hypothetical protein